MSSEKARKFRIYVQLLSLHHFAFGTINGVRAKIYPILYYETWKNAIKKGYKWGEMSWILENNEPMNNAIIMAGGRVYKRYRIYEKEVP